MMTHLLAVNSKAVALAAPCPIAIAAQQTQPLYQETKWIVLMVGDHA
jgi:hypothetical protein